MKAGMIAVYGWNTYHVNDMWWTQGGCKVDVGGRRGVVHIQIM